MAKVNLDNCIMAVEAKRTEEGQIRLKLYAVSGGVGPELTMPDSLAVNVSKVLADVASGKEVSSIG